MIYHQTESSGNHEKEAETAWLIPHNSGFQVKIMHPHEWIAIKNILLIDKRTNAAVIISNVKREMTLCKLVQLRVDC